MHAHENTYIQMIRDIISVVSDWNRCVLNRKRGSSHTRRSYCFASECRYLATLKVFKLRRCSNWLNCRIETETNALRQLEPMVQVFHSSYRSAHTLGYTLNSHIKFMSKLHAIHVNPPMHCRPSTGWLSLTHTHNQISTLWSHNWIVSRAGYEVNTVIMATLFGSAHWDAGWCRSMPCSAMEPFRCITATQEFDIPIQTRIWLCESFSRSMIANIWGVSRRDLVAGCPRNIFNWFLT